MEKLKSSITNMVLVLVGVAVVTGSILAYVNHVTTGPINEQKEKLVLLTREDSSSSFLNFSFSQNQEIIA